MFSYVRNHQDFWTGTLFVVLGGCGLYVGSAYRIASQGKMGPGLFPTIISGCLVCIGVFLVVRSFKGEVSQIEKIVLKNGFLVITSIVSFGALIHTAGIFVAILMLVLISGYACNQFRLAAFITLGLSLATLCVLVFVLGLGLPMPIVGTWFRA